MTTETYADPRAASVIQMAEEMLEPLPMTRICSECGRETFNYWVCDVCVERLEEKLLSSGKCETKSEAMDLLFDNECEAWYCAAGYWGG